MPQLWIYPGAEAVKMVTDDRFDTAEGFKMSNDIEVACRSNDEMTGAKLLYQAQQI